jgi:hypothetical protein
MRAWAWVGLAVLLCLVVLGCQGNSGFETIHPQPRAAFNRCWANVKPNVCPPEFFFQERNEFQCRESAEREFVDASIGKVGKARGRARRQWLLDRGCPRLIADER